MSSRLSHRLTVTTLALALLLALAAPPAQAAQSASALDTLTAKVQTWLSALWPWAGASTKSRGLTDPNGRGHVAGVATSAGHHGRQLVGPIRPACDNSGVTDPNGCPPH